ncbi:hypothetical protein [Anabaena azotica]|uniref:Uncharacterized protein n=1 Tax=Anabaena azotica FACHB-119 TaxID=947527 RepID=A0ABR8DG62_9NOST|nr:hypothetical protein [Anabaena azotica]MBD2505101.1 hypothetical protein [Anabaena azotica FACHB-119]
MLKTAILTAEETNVSIGTLLIKGLMDTNGDYYVGIPQISVLFSFPIKHASRDIKALLYKDSPFPKDFIKLKTSLNFKPINAIPLPDFEHLLIVLDRVKNNTLAQRMRDSLVGLSLHQLFCDAFGVKFEAEDRQNWLKARLLTKETFWFMGAAIEAYYKANPRVEKYQGQNYSEPFDALNLGLFGKKSKVIKTELGIGKSALNRDHFGEKSLKNIEMIQRIAEAQIKYHGNKPVEAVKFAIALMNYPVSDFKQ